MILPRHFPVNPDLPFSASMPDDADALPHMQRDVSARPDAANETADPDAEWMMRVAEDSEEAFAQLVERHQTPLLNFFARMGAYADCEDLVQETFVRLYRYRRQYKATARFTTFLYHLARHVWADRWRKIVRFDRLTTAFQSELEIHARTTKLERPGDAADIEGALDKLSPKLREVIVLNIYQGLRYQEVADVLGIPLGTVKSRINLALAALKEALNED